MHPQEILHRIPDVAGIFGSIPNTNELCGIRILRGKDCIIPEITTLYAGWTPFRNRTNAQLAAQIVRTSPLIKRIREVRLLSARTVAEHLLNSGYPDLFPLLRFKGQTFH